MEHKTNKRLQPGAVVEIPTPKGLAYAQYTHESPLMGSLLRILPGLHATRPTRFSDLVGEPERFVVFFPLRAAVAHGTVQVVSQEQIPERCQAFPLFRTGHRDRATGRIENWWLWDGQREWRVGKLAPEHRNLPTREIWNDTLLIERIIEGWSPSGLDRTTDQYSRKSASADSTDRSQAPDSGDASDLGEDQAVLVRIRTPDGRFGRASDREAVSTLEDQLATEIAKHRAGQFDGDEVGDGYVTVYTYGPSADRLADLILPILQRNHLTEGSYLIKRYGAPGAREARVALSEN